MFVSGKKALGIHLQNLNIRGANTLPNLKKHTKLLLDTQGEFCTIPTLGKHLEKTGGKYLLDRLYKK